MTVMVDLVVIAVLFVFAVAMTYQRPRSWLVADGTRDGRDGTAVPSTPRPGSWSTPSSG